MGIANSGDHDPSALPTHDDNPQAPTPYSFGNIDHYSLTTRIGRGKYSNVFSGHDRSGSLCVIKVLKPVRPSKISREIRILQHLRSGPHICQLLDVVQDPDSKSIALILNWSDNQNIREIMTQMTKIDIAIYIQSVLQALEFAHARGIMHRDVKPGNIMFDFPTKTVTLIDWGLAEYYSSGSKYPVRVATRNYKGPELLFNYAQYEPSIDIWSVGCVLAALLFRKVPFFKAHETADEIIKLGDVFGGKEILNYVEKYNIELSANVANELRGKMKKPWSYWVNANNQEIATMEALDLLGKMLVLDQTQRISAENALKHPFFQCIGD